MKTQKSKFRKYRFGLIAITAMTSFLTISSHAQISCTAKAPSQVAAGQAFHLTFELNERADQLPPPTFANFRYLGGPDQQMSSYTSFVNGQVKSSQSYNYTYTLVADKEGTFTLPATTFVVKNQQVKSNPITITVSASSQNQSSSNARQSTNAQQVQGFNKNDFFIKATVSNSNPYVGEQVIVSYKLYLGPQAYRYSSRITSRPTAQGAWTYDLKAKDDEIAKKEEIIEGKKFVVLDMYSIAVYPQKSGKLTVSPLDANLVVQVLVQQQRSRSNDIFDFFFSDPFSGGNRAQNIDLNLSSNPVTINARELPTTNKPADFSGLVGDFKLSAKLSRDKLNANDAANLSLTLSGSGNLQYIEPLDFHFPSDIVVHDPEIRDNIQTPLSGVSGSRTFEYVLIPRAEGDYVIPSTSFSYFDKRKGSYVTLNTPEFKLNVDKGTSDNTTSFSSANKTDIKRMGSDIRHIKMNVSPRLHETVFFASPFYWAGLFLPVGLLILFIILLRKKIKSRRNIVLLRDKKASKTARKRLRKAEKLLLKKQDEAFYVEISKVLWGYIGDKFHIPPAELSLETARRKLSERHIAEDAIKVFTDTLQDCEYVRFAPSADITPEKMYERTFNFITGIEKELKNGRPS
ncbi:MAG: BatD family protein [Bacteroidales bacterium]|jgi:hypothetical protein|nr:BatD family protein [Bacteroidales bacterium]